MKAFSLFIQDLRDGRTHSEVTAKLGELLEAVHATGKGGSITLKIKVKPSGRGSDVDKVTISDDISVTLPELERGDDMFYLTDEHDLSRQHPRQRSLELRDPVVSTPTTLKELQQ